MTQGDGPISDFINSFKLKFVAARVRAAATPFGPEQASAAAQWVEQAVADAGSRDTSDLMEKRVALFDGCSTIETDSGSCIKLERALEEMLWVLAGQSDTLEPERSAVPEKALAPEAAAAEKAAAPAMAPEKAAAPTGFEAVAPPGFEWGETF